MWGRPEVALIANLLGGLLSGRRVAGGLTGALTGLVVTGGLLLAAADWHGARQARASLKQCELAAGPENPRTDAAGDACPAALRRAIAAARREAACEAALAAGDAAGERASCTTAVKRRGAELAAARAELAGLAAELAGAEGRALAAIARAERRATSIETRKAHAYTAIQTAPRGADGLHLCDAACLRSLARGRQDAN